MDRRSALAGGPSHSSTPRRATSSQQWDRAHRRARGRGRIAPGVIVLLSCLAGATGSASATTTPDVLFSLPVSITDSKLVINSNNPNRYYGHLIQRNGLAATFPRGTLIRFVFTNNGSKTYLPAIKLIRGNIDPYLHFKTSYTFAQHAIQPGRHVALIANFYYRGSFLLQALLHKQPHGKSAQITIT
jgi:hypothetical protein